MRIILRRLAKGLGFLLGAVLLFIAAAVSFALTETGSSTIVRYVLDRVNQGGEFRIEAGEIGGSIISGLNLTDVEFDHPAVNLRARSLHSSWNTSDLLSGNWRIEDIVIDSLALTLPEQDESEAVDESADSAPLDMLPIEFSHVTLNGFTSNIDPLLDTQRLEGRVRLSGSEILLSELTLQSELGEIQGDLILDIASEIGFDSTLQWRLADTAFPPLEGFAGELQLDGDLSVLNVQSSLRSPHQIESRGVLRNLDDMALLQLDLQHEASELNLAAYLEGQALTLSNLQLTTRGSPDQLGIGATGNVLLQTLPVHDFALSGVLGATDLQLESYQLQRNSAAVTGSLIMDWRDQLTVEGTYALQDFDVSEYVSTEQNSGLLPTAITANGDLALSSGSAGLRVSGNVAQISGLIGDSRVSGAAQLSYADDMLTIPQLFLESEELQLSASGTVGASNSLNWSVSLGDLGSFLANASGSLSGSGQLQGTLEAPFVNGAVTGQSLNVAGIQLGTLSALIEGTPEEYEARVDLGQMVYSTDGLREELDSAVLQLQGTDQSLAMTLTTSSPAGSVELALAGGQLRQNPFGWSGQLERLNLEAGMDWQLLAPVGVELSETTVEVQNSCLQSGETTLCFAVQAQPQNGSGDYSASLRALSLSQIEEINQAFPISSLQQLLLPPLPEGLRLSGELDASVSGGYRSDGSAALDFSLGSSNPVMSLFRARDVDPADMVSTEAEERRDYYWRDVVFSGGLQDERWTLAIGGALEQQLVDNNSFPLNGEVDVNLSIDADGSLNGFSNTHFDDLGWLEVYIADISNIRGELNSEFVISGTTELPQVNGYISLANSSFLLDTWGLEIESFEGILTATEDGRAAIEATVTAEEGHLTLTGNAENMLSDAGEMTLRLQGTDFNLMDTPELRASISPDLELISTAESIHIAGSLGLPRLMIALTALPETAIDVSSDVVISRAPADRPDLEYSLAAEQSRFMNRPLTAELDIELGESVSFSGFGLSTELSGSLTTEVLPNGSNRTFGELTIDDGSYSLYGQTLQLQDGSLLFLGPYDNPGLNVRAVREVNDTQVGVQMNGTLRNIQSELFSTPPLAEADIVAMLITGRPISEAGSADEAALLGSIARLGLQRGRSISERVRGTLGLDTFAITNTGDIDNTLLTVGKYLTPSIFVRYGVGLFDSQSKVAVEYELTDTLKLQAESGEHQSLDLTYSIER